MRQHRISGCLQREENESLKREDMEEERIWQVAGSLEGRREEGKREFVRGEKMIRSELIEPESGAGRQLEREIRRLVSACCCIRSSESRTGKVRSPLNTGLDPSSARGASISLGLELSSLPFPPGRSPTFQISLPPVPLSLAGYRTYTGSSFVHKNGFPSRHCFR